MRIPLFCLVVVSLLSIAHADFKIVHAHENENSQVFRVNTGTGETWFRNHHNTWSPIYE